MEYFDTKRVTIPAMESLLGTQIKVLDFGFIRVIDYMGADSSVVQAARVSYGAGTKHLSQDAALINYLMSHSHTTPFEMCEIKLHVKLPIFVARQWVRHRTANINEYSARYSILNEECYVPEAAQIAKQSATNSQGRGELFDAEDARSIIAEFQASANATYSAYSGLLDRGVSRELARMNLTLAHYTEWYWKIDLHNLLNFLKLRASEHAQYEIRVYAEAILDIVKAWVPLTYEAFAKYVLKAKTISEDAQTVLKDIIRGEDVKFENSKLTKREWKYLLSMLGLDEG